MNSISVNIGTIFLYVAHKMDFYILEVEGPYNM
jgi:hypothetical protein